jgi:hypothetical protein
VLQTFLFPYLQTFALDDAALKLEFSGFVIANFPFFRRAPFAALAWI